RGGARRRPSRSQAGWSCPRGAAPGAAPSPRRGGSLLPADDDQVRARHADLLSDTEALAVLDVGFVELLAPIPEALDHGLERRRRGRPQLPELLAVGAFEDPRAALDLEAEGRTEQPV